jgi:DNA-binding beta-propeller fold protein YncE
MASSIRSDRWHCTNAVAFLCAILAAGCSGVSDKPELVWGKRGVQGGNLVKPRAIAIDAEDRLYLVDWTARIQAFNRDGKFLGHVWTTPDYRNGRPSGLSVDSDGNLVVSDSHYHCVRIYSPEGTLLRTIGGTAGTGEGELSYISDTVRDRAGNFYIAEFGDNQRISKFDAEGRFVVCWGAPGSEPGQFARIRALTLGPDGNLYAADACNHRIQVFTTEGKFVRMWGEAGTQQGQLSYPYDLAFSPGPQPNLYVVEYGNHRVQKFDLDGNSLGCWGGPGREPGRLASPWALAVDRSGRVHVVDSDNDRIQRIEF